MGENEGEGGRSGDEGKSEVIVTWGGEEWVKREGRKMIVTMC